MKERLRQRLATFLCYWLGHRIVTWDERWYCARCRLWNELDGEGWNF